MRSNWMIRPARMAALALAAALLSACGMFGGGTRTDGVITQAANIPTSFDVTLVADKDNQFDYDPEGGTNGAPLNSLDLESALRYRQEENLPISTVLLKRGEKQKVKKEHLGALVRIADKMGFKAYVDEKGVISELQASGK